MEITKVKVRVFEFPEVSPVKEYRNAILTYRRGGRGRLTLTEVHSDEDLVGYGFGYAREELRRQLLGEDPMDVERIWRKMFSGWRKPVAKGYVIREIGVLDVAVWDLVGKALGKPVYKLLGGYRSRVPAYAAGGYYEEGKGVEDLRREMASYVDEGYRAVKMKVGLLPLDKDAERVRAVRETVGDDVALMVDANNAYKAYEAVKFARMIERYDPYWFEEPVYPDDLEGCLKVSRSTSIPTASGENEYTRWGFRDLVETGCVDIIQPDVHGCGGFTEARKIAAIASAHHTPFSPHGSRLHFIAAHMVAAFDNGLTVESIARSSPLWRDEAISSVDFYEKQLDVVDGYIELPNRPGLGVEINDKVARRYEVRCEETRLERR